MKLPRTWPKSSDSRSESGRPAQLSVTSDARRRDAAVVDQSRDDFLADAGLAGDQDLRVGARGELDLGFDRADRVAAADEANLLLVWEQLTMKCILSALTATRSDFRQGNAILSVSRSTSLVNAQFVIGASPHVN